MHFQFIILYHGFMDASEYGILIRNNTSMGFVCTTRIRVGVSGEIERRKELVQPVDFLEFIRSCPRSVVGLYGLAYTEYLRRERISQHESSVPSHWLCGLYH